MKVKQISLTINNRLKELETLKKDCHRDFLKNRDEGILNMVSILNMQYGIEIDFLKKLLLEIK